MSLPALPVDERVAGPVKRFLDELAAQGFIALDAQIETGDRGMGIKLRLTKRIELGDTMATQITLEVEERPLQRERTPRW